MQRRSLTVAGVVVLVAGGLIAGGAGPAWAADPYRIGMSAAITGRAATTYAPTYEAYRRNLL